MVSDWQRWQRFRAVELPGCCRGRFAHPPAKNSRARFVRVWGRGAQSRTQRERGPQVSPRSSGGERAAAPPVVATVEPLRSGSEVRRCRRAALAEKEPQLLPLSRPWNRYAAGARSAGVAAQLRRRKSHSVRPHEEGCAPSAVACRALAGARTFEHLGRGSRRVGASLVGVVVPATRTRVQEPRRARGPSSDRPANRGPASWGR